MTDSSVSSFEAIEDFSVAYIQHSAFGGSDIEYEVFTDSAASDDEIVADDAGEATAVDDIDADDVDTLDDEQPEDIADLDGDANE